MTFLTADLIDAHGDQLQSCALQFRNYGGLTRFHGRVRTIETHEDNALIRKVLEQPGEGAVLVVDGKGSLQAALLGDLLAALAHKNGWAGLIIHGAVRDTVALGAVAIGIKALGSNPRKSTKHATGRIDARVSFGRVTFQPGSWVYSDEDGLVVSARRLD